MELFTGLRTEMGSAGADDRGLQEREPLPRVDGRRHHRQQEEEGGTRGGND